LIVLPDLLTAAHASRGCFGDKMLVLGLDFESTGLDVANDRIIEVGAVLWDTERSSPLCIYNELVAPGVPITDEITKITGITNGDLSRFGVPSIDALTVLATYAGMAHYIVAHNGTMFDQPLLKAELARVAVPWPDKPWIDTSVDIPFPDDLQVRKLSYLAAEHGFLNPFSHRAFADVLTMLKIMSMYDFEAVKAMQASASVTAVAALKKPWEDTAPEGKKDVDLARARGYRWNTGAKVWQKILKACHVDKEVAAAPFKIKILGDK